MAGLGLATVAVIGMGAAPVTGRHPGQVLALVAPVMAGMVVPVAVRADPRADLREETFARTATSAAVVTAGQAVEIADT